MIAVLLFGCASISADPEDSHQTIEASVASEAFQAENRPIRTLDVALLLGDGNDESEARDAVEQASQLLTWQVGVTLQVKLVQKVHWVGRSFGGVHRDIKKFRSEHPDYDIVIGAVHETEDFLAYCPEHECVKGTTEEWRNIVITRLWPRAIAHEVGHTLLENWFHSPSGIMTASNDSPFFSVADRKKILWNKWRDYRKSPAWFERCPLGF